MYYSNEPIYTDLRAIANELEKELEQSEMSMYESGKIIYERLRDYAEGIAMSEVYEVVRGLYYCEIALDCYIDELMN